MNKTYISYLGQHYQALQERVSKLILEYSFPGNENPTVNYMGIYTIYRDKEDNYIISKQQTPIFKCYKDRLHFGDIELTIIRDLAKNPWATAPYYVSYEVMKLEESITFLLNKVKFSNEEETNINFYQQILSQLYSSLLDWGTQPPTNYLQRVNGLQLDTITLMKSVCPNRWELISNLVNQIISKEGYGDSNWKIYLESLLSSPGHSHKLDENSPTALECEIELFCRVFELHPLID